MPIYVLVLIRLGCLLLGLTGLIGLIKGLILMEAFPILDGAVSLILAGLILAFTTDNGEKDEG